MRFLVWISFFFLLVRVTRWKRSAVMSIMFLLECFKCLLVKIKINRRKGVFGLEKKGFYLLFFFSLKSIYFDYWSSIAGRFPTNWNTLCDLLCSSSVITTISKRCQNAERFYSLIRPAFIFIFSALVSSLHSLVWTFMKARAIHCAGKRAHFIFVFFLSSSSSFSFSSSSIAYAIFTTRSFKRRMREFYDILLIL